MTHTNKSEIDLIICEYLREELLLKGHHWQTNRLVRNTNELILNSNGRRNVINCLCTLSQSMRTTFSEQLSQMCAKLDNEVADLTTLDYESFQDVANELFSQGIKWGHIVCLLVFGSELILTTINDNPSRELIDNISQFLCTYLNDNLLNWINDHAGWQGLINYCNENNVDTGEGSTVVDGIMRKIHNWHENKYLRLGAAISVVGIILGCVLISAKK